MNTSKKIVCLGGGIGTVNLITGLKTLTDSLTVVASMADEGGSSGRLRRMYNILPPGDLVSCMSALIPNTDQNSKKLLMYRFPGDRYGKDEDLGGHKLGNLMMVAMRDLTGNFNDAVEMFREMFHITGTILPATEESVSISAETIEGKIIHGEETIDLGRYQGKRILEKVFLHPENPHVSEKVLTSLSEANTIIAGPGDLYTTLLPVMITPLITEAFKKSSAQKVFIVNVANKPFETKDYSVSHYIHAVIKHLGEFPFDTVVVNNNYEIEIPKKYKYTYVHVDTAEIEKLGCTAKIVEADLVDDHFPLYHNSEKLARTIEQIV